MKNVIAMVVLSLTACTDEAASLSAEPSPAAVAETRWAAVGSSDGLVVATALAQVKGVGLGRGAEVTSPQPGRIRRLLVGPGDTLAVGDPVAEISSPDLAVAAARARGARSEEEVLLARVAQLETLVGEGLARADQLTDARRMLASVRATRRTSEALIRASEVDARSVSRTGYIVLRSPVEGVVASVDGRIGSPVAPDVPLIRIAGVGPVRVVARAASPFPPVRAVLRTDEGDHPLRALGRPVRDEDGLWLAFFEPVGPHELRDGEQWPLHLESDGSYVAVPATALSGREGRDAVVVRRRDGHIERVRVAVERVDGVRAIVRGDVREGDEVAVDPALVFEGAA